MKINLSVLSFLSLIALGASGCSSSDAAAATAEQKKAFGGGPPPSNYMNGVKSGAADAQGAAAKNGK